MDSPPAIDMIKAGQLNKHTKHIQVRFYYLNAAFMEGVFHPMKVSTHENPADLSTKALTTKKFQKFSNKLIYSSAVKGEC